MSVKLIIEEPKTPKKHHLKDYFAFLDSDNDFYIIRFHQQMVIRIGENGYIEIHSIDEYETIEEFLHEEFSDDLSVQRVYDNQKNVEIIIKC